MTDIDPLVSGIVSGVIPPGAGRAAAGAAAATATGLAGVGVEVGAAAGAADTARAPGRASASGSDLTILVRGLWSRLVTWSATPVAPSGTWKNATHALAAPGARRMERSTDRSGGWNADADAGEIF